MSKTFVKVIAEWDLGIDNLIFEDEDEAENYLVENWEDYGLDCELEEAINECLIEFVEITLHKSGK